MANILKIWKHFLVMYKEVVKLEFYWHFLQDNNWQNCFEDKIIL